MSVPQIQRVRASYKDMQREASICGCCGIRIKMEKAITIMFVALKAAKTGDVEE